MKSIREVKNIVFDYDGTLHQCIISYESAFKKAYEYLVKNNLVEERNFTKAEISQWLGVNSKEMWDKFMPSLSEEEKNICSSIIGKEMLLSVENNEAKLYDDVIDLLKDLKDKGYNLILLSNCKKAYIDAHKKNFNLERYFDDFYCAESFDFMEKHKIFNDIKNKYRGSFIIIGDRESDIEIASIHDEIAIACAYGYGEYKEFRNAQYIVGNIGDIRRILEL